VGDVESFGGLLSLGATVLEKGAFGLGVNGFWVVIPGGAFGTIVRLLLLLLLLPFVRGQCLVGFLGFIVPLKVVSNVFHKSLEGESFFIDLAFFIQKLGC
jgi:hypothetical protein